MVKVCLISFLIILTLGVGLYEILMFFCRKRDYFGIEDDDENEDKNGKEE